MRLPSKITPYCDSILPQLPKVLDLLDGKGMNPSELYGAVKTGLDGLGEFYEILDCLYALGAIELIAPEGVLRHVK